MEDRGILRRIKDNDPGLVELTIGIGRRGDYFPSDGDWEGLGNDIAKNTSLRMLHINTDPDDDEVTAADLVVFFGAISTNTSLRELILPGLTCLGEEELRALAPIFKNNKSIERLEIGLRELPCLPLLASALAEANSLKAFKLQVSDDDEPVERGETIIKALSNHHGLEELILWNVQIGRDGCALLSDMLLNRQSKLAVLDLRTINEMYNDHASILAIGLAGSIALRHLRLKLFRAPSKSSEKAWQYIFLALKSPSSKLEKLYLDDTTVTSVAEIHLSDVLANSQTLKALNLHLNRNIAMASWRALSEYLQSPRCLMEEIDLGYCNISDESMECFSNSMAKNRSVKKLSLGCIRTITPAGWVAFSNALQNPGSALESLDLSDNELDEGAFELICNGISSNNKLKELVIRWIENVPSEGWRISVPHLLNTNTSLEKLDLRFGSIDHDTAIFLVQALANNAPLKEFLMDTWFMEDDSWAVFSSILCNGSSIKETYESNHTLQILGEGWRGGSVVPDVIESLLHINRNNSKSQAARLKIALTHFGGGFIAPPFKGMGVKLLPHALAWMSRAVGMNDVDGHFYEFVKDCLFQTVGTADQGGESL